MIYSLPLPRRSRTEQPVQDQNDALASNVQSGRLHQRQAIRVERKVTRYVTLFDNVSAPGLFSRAIDCYCAGKPRKAIYRQSPALAYACGRQLNGPAVRSARPCVCFSCGRDIISIQTRCSTALSIEILKVDYRLTSDCCHKVKFAFRLNSNGK